MTAGGRARRRVIAHGTVQGVFFRQTLQRLATAADVSGWARNRADGSMEACLEGPAAAVAELAGWCAEGPPGARVTRVEVLEEEPEGIAGFAIG